MKASILTAARAVLVREGLPGWTVDKVADEAGCTKGLVIYHFHNRDELLQRVGELLRADRQRRRLEALSHRGTSALDALWKALRDDVRSGEFGAWLGLCSLPAGPIHAAATATREDCGSLGTAAARAVDLPGAVDGALLDASLTGFQVALQGVLSEEAVQDAYHKFWLGLL